MFRKLQFNSYQLKLIAIATMVIDHALKIFNNDIFTFCSTHFPSQLAMIGWIYTIILALGRISFPIFIYLIAKGCHYTHDIKKYFYRLLLFACISELPFQYMISIILEKPGILSFTNINIFFTLALGVFSIIGYQYLKEKTTVSLLPFLSPILLAILSSYLHSDYSFWGVLLIFTCYVWKDEKHIFIALATYIVYSNFVVPMFQDVIIYQDATILYSIQYIIFTIIGLLVIPILSKYNGQLGKSTKYIFYFFYPVHIALFCGIYFLTH